MQALDVVKLVKDAAMQRIEQTLENNPESLQDHRLLTGGSTMDATSHILGRQMTSAIIVALLLGLLAGCAGVAQETATPAPSPQEAMPGIPNPASVFCEEQGGTVDVRTAEDGSQTGYCVFGDGSE
jgi:putative hemolysin